MMPDLGAYAVPVLGSYAVTLALIAGLTFVSLRRARKTRDALKKLESEIRKHE